jgi:hypothetical protein
MEFSKDLVEEYKQYMLEDHNYVVSDEQAQSDLGSLSRLFLAFANSQTP